MKLSSPVFENQQHIPTKYTCDGPNVSPPLRIDDVSPFATSLVLIMDDPDAPGGTFTHWTMWNMPAKNMPMEEGTIPTGAIEGITSFNQPGYGGPCPPKNTGVHHYRFKLYAIDTTLPLDDTATVEEITNAIEGHVLESCSLVGLYTKDN